MRPFCDGEKYFLISDFDQITQKTFHSRMISEDNIKELRTSLKLCNKVEVDRAFEMYFY